MRDLPQVDQQAVVNTSTSGDNSIVSATSGAITRVNEMRLTAAGAVTVTVKRGSTTLDVIQMVAGVPYILPLRLEPYYRTAANEAFILNLGGAVAVTGVVSFTKS